MKRPIALFAIGVAVAALATTRSPQASASPMCHVDAATSFALDGTACTGDVRGTGVLDQVTTAGRVQTGTNAVRFSWPGVYFEGRFRGTGVGVLLDDQAAHYDVQVDGKTVTTLVHPTGTRWINGLTNAEHTIRLVKRSESQWATSTFGGLVAASGGTILAKPAPRARQIEFIGDSYTAGYGLESTSRDCPGDAVARTTNADKAFGALTARRLGADYQINAFSGRGMVRNYNGGDPGTSYRTYYDRALLAVNGDVWQKPASWRPQLVVVGLGINDFSTALRPGEPWTNTDRLIAAYKTAYQGFLDKLRARYGDDTVIIVSATESSNNVFLNATRQIVADRNNHGDTRVRHWYYDSAGLDHRGCDWHPSAHDHQVIADRLATVISTLPLHW